MQGIDYQDLDRTPETTSGTTVTLAANTAHLARRLKSAPYPPSGVHPAEVLRHPHSGNSGPMNTVRR